MRNNASFFNRAFAFFNSRQQLRAMNFLKDENRDFILFAFRNAPGFFHRFFE